MSLLEGKMNHYTKALALVILCTLLIAPAAFAANVELHGKSPAKEARSVKGSVEPLDSPQKYSIVFYVTDKAGNSIDRTIIKVWNGKNAIVELLTSNSLARAYLAPGIYTYTVEAKGYLSQKAELRVDRSDRTVMVVLEKEKQKKKGSKAQSEQGQQYQDHLLFVLEKGDDVKVKMLFFYDLTDPFSKRFYEQTLPYIKKKWIDTELMKLVFIPWPLEEFYSLSMPAAVATACVGDVKGASAQEKFVSVLFEKRDEWKSLTPAGFNEKLYDYINSAGIRGKKARDAFNTCWNNNEYATRIREYQNQIYMNEVEYGTPGVHATPTFWLSGLNGYQDVIVGAQPASVFYEKIEAALQDPEEQAQEMQLSLRDYPAPFVDHKKANSAIVVASQGSTAEIVAAITLANALWEELKKNEEATGYPIYLDTEVISGEKSAENYIIIDVAGNNRNMLAPQELYDRLGADNWGIIRLVLKEGKHYLYIGGTTPEMTKTAVSVLANYRQYKDYLLKDTVIVKGTPDAPEIVSY